MRQAKIIVIEDEPDIRDVIQYNLNRAGYRTVCCGEAEEGFRAVQKENPDLILLDLMLPGADGLELCRRFKAHEGTKNIPIIMVTAKDEESDIVAGLEIGADDYVTKPFRPRELMARVKAVLRRGSLQAPRQKDRIVMKDLVVDVQKHEASLAGKPLKFTPTEFKLLSFLASHPGRVFTRDQLLDRVMGQNAIVVDRNIDVHVRFVRKKLGDRKDFIATIRGVGYRFAEP